MRTTMTAITLVLAGATMAAFPAFAEGASAGSDELTKNSADGEIVVTAQRREQSLLEVPISITAFTAETLEKANVSEAKDYLAFVP